MTAVAGGAAGGAAAAAVHIANIKKMIGPVAFVEEDVLIDIVDKAPGSIVVWSRQGVFSKKYRYITNAFGLTWYCKTLSEISFRSSPTLVLAGRISVPE